MSSNRLAFYCTCERATGSALKTYATIKDERKLLKKVISYADMFSYSS
jgi:hypothetical protein